MLTNYRVQGANLVGTEQKDESYQVPEFKGTRPKCMFYTVQRGVIYPAVHKHTMELLDQAGKVGDASKRLTALKSNSASSTNRINQTAYKNSVNQAAKELDNEAAKFERQVTLWDYHREAYAAAPDYEEGMNKVVKAARGIVDRNKKTLLRTILKVALTILVVGGSLFGGVVVGGSLGMGLIAFGALVLAGATAFASINAYKNRNASRKDLADTVFRNIERVQGNPVYDQACEHFRAKMSFVPSVEHKFEIIK